MHSIFRFHAVSSSGSSVIYMNTYINIVKNTLGILVQISCLLGTCRQPAYESNEESKETKEEEKRFLLLTNCMAIQKGDHFSNGSRLRGPVSNQIHENIDV